jgi:hypothetical protein
VLHVGLFVLAISSAVCIARQRIVLDANTGMAYHTFVVERGAAHVSVLYGPSEFRERCS